MTENNLKNMIENHELDNLMTNSDELEKLKSSKTTEQVLDILKKYNYTETKEVFERELLEILQSIKLNGEEMKSVSGGRIMNTKNLSMVLGSLMALNSAGFMSAGAVTEKQKNTKKYSVESLLNKVDTQTVEHIGLGAAGIGLIWAIKEIVTPRRDNANFKLNSKEIVTPRRDNTTFKLNSKEIVTPQRDNTTFKLNSKEIVTPQRDNTTFELDSTQKQIYDNTKELSYMILEYVEGYIKEHNKMPEAELNRENPEHRGILGLIREIRTNWFNVYENNNQLKLTEEEKQEAIGNEVTSGEYNNICTVGLEREAIENLFYGLPVDETIMFNQGLPESPENCTDREMAFYSLIHKVHATYAKRFDSLEETVNEPNGNGST